MLGTTSLARTSCAYCRLRLLIEARRNARSRGIGLNRWAARSHIGGTRSFTSTTFTRESNDQISRNVVPVEVGELSELLSTLDATSKSFKLAPGIASLPLHEIPNSSIDEVVRQARQAFGNALPDGYLNDVEYKLYERLYGPPVGAPVDEEADLVDFDQQNVRDELDEDTNVGTGLLREANDGTLEEVTYMIEEDEIDQDAEEEEDLIAEEQQDIKALKRLERTKRGRFFIKATKAELDAAVLAPSLSMTHLPAWKGVDEEWKMLNEAGKTMYLHDVRYMKLERQYNVQGDTAHADELVQFLFLRYQAAKDAEADMADVQEPKFGVEPTYADAAEEEAQVEGDVFVRSHPLTRVNRFGTLPSTIQLPSSIFADPISALISGSSPKHLADSAHRIFGGTGLPYSTSNPALAKTLQQKPIPLGPYDSKMSEIEADAYLAAVMPGVYASVTSVIVETRKRLGSSWLQDLMTKEGGPRILDAGGAGAGIVAARQVMQAEWENMHDSSQDPASVTALAEAGGQTGGAPVDAPVGRASVLVANEALRVRVSKLLDDTTFLPRLPDYIHASDEQAKERGKYDIIIAPHTLWPLKEDYLRKQHVASLWSLLSAKGGVLILLEKGVPRGFEMVALAREFLLDKRIASPGNEKKAEELAQPGEPSIDGVRQKEKGMILAPCTNHSACPMYMNKGVTKGRKDLCHFQQRYIRPPFLQKILGAKDKNHEDVKFSYVSIMRGRDLRDHDEEAIVQGDRATDRAFAGYEVDALEEDTGSENDFDPTAPAVPDVEEVYGAGAVTAHSLSLPRAILPPLKRTGHVIMDFCTPSGTLERWTVPRSFSKQAFHDARKSSWGDLWALGAKTRIPRTVRVGRGKEELGGVDRKGAVDVKAKSRDGFGGEKKKPSRAKNIIEVGYDSQGNIAEEDVRVVTGGRMRQGKVKGIRDKRDKKATGRGRRKEMMET